MSYAIQAEGLVKRFGSTTALAGVDLAARTGSILGVLGPNGAGKTTAVRVLATLIKPDEGRARVGGFDTIRDAHKVRELIGLTGQYASVDEELTGLENLILLGRLLELSRKDARQRARDLLERFGLTDAAGRPASTYSGGMRRRLDLAASLVGRPTVLYLDEPTTGLDPHARAEVWDVIRGLVADGVTVLLTTQYLDEADQLTNEIAVIDHGRVVANGTPAQLKAKAGAQRLEIRPALASDLPAVARLMTELAGVAPTEGADPGLLGVPVHDPAVMTAAVRRLEDARIVVRELALRLPSLDEVFLALTGHRAEPIGAGNEPTGPRNGPAGPPSPADETAATEGRLA
ncbi:daunorubicin resistance protein DrrA family ABC transporter ATP-binding protein [Actinopolymorpha alba]|uniref:daunorubicin resistance protein DrrA family ABC transporter ATP-binding protein n=1 Tax=Actinopolymorpha alba TaxID=533267 RepID=UPI000374E41B|nr:daunorubicin resistance protein DrrA family ABC transporter ATP-binding protein [Actinopolymorpha alba]